LNKVFTSFHLRRLVAVLFIAVLVFAAISPASGPSCAVLVPLALLAVAMLYVDVVREGKEPEIQPLAFLWLVISRAPPVV
jgi:hypothetical protein